WTRRIGWNSLLVFEMNRCSLGSYDAPQKLMPPAGPGGEMLYWSTPIGMNGPPSFMLLSSTMCSQYDCSCGSPLYRLLRETVICVSGGGFTGNGCVGDVRSRGNSLFGTVRSSMSKIGFPVTRFSVNIKPVLLTMTTAGTVLPSRTRSTSMGADCV